MRPEHGAIAQLGERLDRTQEVSGSSPLSSILFRKIEIRREADFARVRPLKGRLGNAAAGHKLAEERRSIISCGFDKLWSGCGVRVVGRAPEDHLNEHRG